MSTFTPLNLSSDSKKLVEEEENQTRELQVEEGFKIFQRSLELQKECHYKESSQSYGQLFRLDVLKPRANEAITPSIRTLRYLACKNRGLLSLKILKEEYEEKLGKKKKKEKRSRDKHTKEKKPRGDVSIEKSEQQDSSNIQRELEREKQSNKVNPNDANETTATIESENKSKSNDQMRQNQLETNTENEQRDENVLSSKPSSADKNTLEATNDLETFEDKNDDQNPKPKSAANSIAGNPETFKAENSISKNQSIEVIQIDEDDNEWLLEKLSKIITDLLDALNYSETADDDLVDVLFDIFMFFDNPRLSRFLLEYQLANSHEELDLLSVSNMLELTKLLPPSLIKLFKRLNLVLNSVHDDEMISKNNHLKVDSRKKTAKKLKKLQKQLDRTLSCFTILKQQDSQARSENLKEIDSIVIELSEMSLPLLINKIENLYENTNKLPKTSSSNNNSGANNVAHRPAIYYGQGFDSSSYTHLDPLLSSSFDTTDRVIIEANFAVSKHTKEDSFEVIEATESTAPADSDTDKNQDRKTGPQRSSKRFRGAEEMNELSKSKFTELRDEFERFELSLGALNIDTAQIDNVLSNIVEHFVDDENGAETIEEENADYKSNIRNLIRDFNSCLKSWDKRKSSIILGLHSKPQPRKGGGGSVLKGDSILGIFNKPANMASTKEVGATKGDKVITAILKNSAYDLVSSEISKINSPSFNSNIYQIRFSLLIGLLNHSFIVDNRELNLLVDFQFEKKETFVLNIKKYIDYYQYYIFAKLSHVLFSGSLNAKLYQQQKYSYLRIVVSILEVLIDDYIGIASIIKQRENLTEKEINEKNNLKQALETRISQWLELTDLLFEVFKTTASNPSEKTWFRYNWALYLYSQTGEAVADAQDPASFANLKTAKSKEILQKLLDAGERQSTPIEILYHNYNNFPPLSASSIKEFLKRISFLESFSKIMKGNENANGIEGKDDQNTETISEEMVKLLDLALSSFEISSLLQMQKLSEDEKLVYKFVSESSFEIRLKLRNLLFDYFHRKALADGGTPYSASYQHNFEVALDAIVKYLNSNEYSDLTDEQRQFSLVKMLRYFEEISLKFINILKFHSWKSHGSITTTSLLNLVFILSILQIYYLNKVSVEIAETSFNFPTIFKRAAQQLQDLSVNCYILIYVYLKHIIVDNSTKGEPDDTKARKLSADKKIFEIISNFHALLGYGAMCDSGAGNFLDLLQQELLSLESVYVDLEVFQLVNCKYHLPLTTDYFVPYDHNTESVNLDRPSALILAKRFLKLAFEKRDPYFNTIKSDLKAILDAVYEVIGDPNTNYERIVRADAIIETYLNNSLNPKFLREAMYGLLSIDISKTRLDIQDAVDGGLYYIQGVMALSLFKIRKRTMQGRSAELDFVIRMFKSDLLCGTNRFESWVLLGQSYSFLVEDDLIWTSDKLNSDKKNNTALLQKRALLCYLMAISIYAQMNKNKISLSQKMISTLWSLFSKELYNSEMRPMSKLCYEFSTTPKILDSPVGYIATHYEKPLTNKTIYKTTLLAFKMAAKFLPEDWSNYYYIASLQAKLDYKSAPVAIENLLKACEISKKHNSNSVDPIIEPHYRLSSLIYKSVKRNVISVKDAIEYLKKDDDFFQFGFSEYETQSGEQELTFRMFAKLCLNLLKRILSHDKKKWHHKPRYRIAKILYEDFHNIEAAKEEMMNMITLKLTHKNLVTIWKPENERPGKHFIYAYDYVNFYVLLLEKSDALSSLCLVLKKLRRFGSGMVNMLGAWENACHTACQLVREMLGFDRNYTDSTISALSYKDFIEKSQNFLTELKNNGLKAIDEKMLMLMYEVSEIRRMNNGFGTTAEIDDTFGAIYLLVYQRFVKDSVLNSKKEEEADGKTQENSTESKNDDTTDSTNRNLQVQSQFVFETGMLPGQNTSSALSAIATSLAETPAPPALPVTKPSQDLPGKPGPTKTKVARRDLYPRAIAILKMLSKEIEELQKKYEFYFDKLNSGQSEKAATKEPNAEAAEKNLDGKLVNEIKEKVGEKEDENQDIEIQKGKKQDDEAQKNNNQEDKTEDQSEAKKPTELPMFKNDANIKYNSLFESSSDVNTDFESVGQTLSTNAKRKEKAKGKGKVAQGKDVIGHNENIDAVKDEKANFDENYKHGTSNNDANDDVKFGKKRALSMPEIVSPKKVKISQKAGSSPGTSMFELIESSSEDDVAFIGECAPLEELEHNMSSHEPESTSKKTPEEVPEKKQNNEAAVETEESVLNGREGRKRKVKDIEEPSQPRRRELRDQMREYKEKVELVTRKGISEEASEKEEKKKDDKKSYLEQGPEQQEAEIEGEGEDEDEEQNGERGVL